MKVYNLTKADVIIHSHVSLSKVFLLFSCPADDGPYSKGNKDSTGPDNSLTSRRQSIPGTLTLFLCRLFVPTQILPAPFLQRLLILGIMSVFAHWGCLSSSCHIGLDGCLR